VATNRSKQQGGNRATFFSVEMNEQAMVRLELESYLRKALHKDEFYLCYQPLIDLESGNLYGSEALIRWNHPKLGLISPGEFIPLAEETGLIEEIGSWVLRTACKQNMRWQTLGYDSLSISVNVSAYQFQQPGFLDEVKKALELSGMEPQYLTLELTESTMLRNVEYSIQVMQALQALGVKVSIDDFGTGYSSLSYLKDLPINTLKIDRSFINNLRLNTSDIAIVKAIITMGHGLAVKVVAEGVETKEQIELLKELKCHYAQGFYIHKPLMTTEFEEGLSKKVQMYS
jgi:EAL domain-containing protein (putative c-di-GMP-specific phosphodiesterase class I)